MDRPDLAQELFRLASADNFRDVAGTGDGHPTRDGGRVRRGAFFRSNELQLSDEETLTVTGLGLTAVHDLRTEVEVEAHPDVVLPGAEWRHLDVTGIPMDDVVELADEEAAVALMERVYRAFVESPRARRAFGSLLHHLAHDDGPQLFHCTAGKDRTGWAAVLLLHVAGVPEEIIVEDYLLTNDYTRSSRARYLTMAESALGADQVPVYERVLVADTDYLEVAQGAVVASYGDLDGYLVEGLRLDRATLERLRGRLTD